MNACAQFVLGYGSLAAEHDGCPVAVLRGWRRVWGVAMDNRVDLPGYKSYRLRSDGSRPAAFVCFLDIEPDPAAAVTGVCMPVDERRLRELDDRERNYDARRRERCRSRPPRAACGRTPAPPRAARGCARVSRAATRSSAATIATPR